MQRFKNSSDEYSRLFKHFHLLSLNIPYRGNGARLIRYHCNSSCVFMCLILSTTIKQGEFEADYS